MWIYPVDMKRANEFGQVFDKEKAELADDKIKSEIEKEPETETSQVKRRDIRKSERKY